MDATPLLNEAPLEPNPHQVVSSELPVHHHPLPISRNRLAKHQISERTSNALSIGIIPIANLKRLNHSSFHQRSPSAMVTKSINSVLKAFIKVNIVDCRITTSFRVEDTKAVAATGKNNKGGLLPSNNARNFSQRVIWNRVIRATPKESQLAPSCPNTG